MNNLLKLPSPTEVKDYVVDSLKTYYPIVRDEAQKLFEVAKDGAGRSYNWVSQKAVQHPLSTVFAANTVLALTCAKVNVASVSLLSHVFSIKTAKAITLAVDCTALVALNYALASALVIPAIPVALAAAAGCTTAACIFLLVDLKQTKYVGTRKELITEIYENEMRLEQNARLAYFAEFSTEELEKRASIAKKALEGQNAAETAEELEEETNAGRPPEGTGEEANAGRAPEGTGEEAEAARSQNPDLSSAGVGSADSENNA